VALKPGVALRPPFPFLAAAMVMPIGKLWGVPGVRRCQVLGASELAKDPKFIKNTARVGKEIVAIFASYFLKNKVKWTPPML
jgi:hypothetical protein